jgi:hypothetical protein
VRHGLLARLLTRLSDQDKQVASYNGPLLVPKHNMAPLDASMLVLQARKFACFAVGNASFHNATAYEALKPGIPDLVLLLHDTEAKT